MFYSGTWDRAMQIGVCPVGYSFYDILYSDELSPLAETAATTDDLIVVMKNQDYKLLISGSDLVLGDKALTGVRKLASWTSSVHFTQSRLEEQIEFTIWKKHL